MPIATPEVYGEMIDRAKEQGFAYPAINVTSSQTSMLLCRGSLRPVPTASSRSPPVAPSTPPARR